jgi:hypothetical protein
MLCVSRVAVGKQLEQPCLIDIAEGDIFLFQCFKEIAADTVAIEFLPRNTSMT